MRKTILMALALVAGASFMNVEAAQKKKVAQKQAAPAVQPVVLASGSDSVSYAGGMSITNGLIPFLVQQQGVDTAYIADFVRGFQEVVKSGDNPAAKAYAAGINIAAQVRDRMLPGMSEEFKGSPDSIVAGLFYRGFADALQGDTTVFTQKGAESYFRQKQEADKAAKEERLYGANREAGRKFLAENATKEGVVTLPSGLQYKVLTQGTGEVPQRTDKVQVNYEGRLVDGTVFDASARHGDKPSEFRPDQVIKGWTEALTMMPVGSKWQLYIPYDLAYGSRDMGEIKPYSTLVFDVELVGIDKPQPAEPAEAPADNSKTKKSKKSKK